MATHDTHAVCAPPVLWYVPTAHGTHTGEVVAVHVPDRYMPALHDVVHAAHAVMVLSWYMPAVHGGAAQTVVVVAVHEPESSSPAPHDVGHSLHAVCAPGASW